MQGFWTGWAEYILEVSFIVDLSLPVGFDDWSRTLLKRGGSARLRVLALFEVFYVSIDKLEPTVSFNFYLGGKWSPSKVTSSLFCPLLKLQLPPIHPSRPIDFEKSLLRLYNQSTTPSTNSDNYKLSPQSISGALIWIIYISCEKKKKRSRYINPQFSFRQRKLHLPHPTLPRLCPYSQQEAASRQEIWISGRHRGKVWPSRLRHVLLRCGILTLRNPCPCLIWVEGGFWLV